VPLMALYLRESPAFRLHQQQVHAHQPSRLAQFAAILSHGRAARTLVLWACFVLTLIIQYLLLSWLPTLMIGSGLSKPQAAYAQIGFNVGGALAAALIGHLLEGRWRKPSVYAAFIALPLLMFALSQARADVALMTMLATGIGCAVLSALAFLYACAPICYPTHIRGTGVGAAVGAGRVGSIIGPLIGGTLVGMGHSSGQLLRDLLPVAIAAAVCAAVLVSMHLEKGHHVQEKT
jgi:MFS transporter, AAHS family, 3-hydroxyphenylpropionic acid transporter